jgi:methylated-DNA-[protein]-cysteine S-methyltransferase
LLLEAGNQLAAYFAGKLREFHLPLEMAGTDFQLRVWNRLLQIPYGETRSYGELARALGTPAAVRAVGAANGANPIAIVVPCHRVIGSNGALTGYGGGLPLKRRLLELERSNTSLLSEAHGFRV